jgi:DHA1 family tetracycline resistance protein-like MFS transporter
MSAVVKRVGRIVIRRDLLAVFAMVFLADAAIGIFRPTISLYARSLGASLTMIGALGGIEGLTRILFAVPIGMLSDTKGRRGVMSAGLLLFAASYFLYTIAPGPHFLFPIRVMTGLSVASTFFIGIAYVSDIVDQRDRGLVIGLYTTCMGLGFAVGSAIGGLVAEDYGFGACYRVAAVIALLGFAILHLGPADKSTRQRKAGSGTSQPLVAKLALLVKEPNILAASLGNMLISVVLEGAIFNFYPLYAASLSVSEAAIGSMFSVRALMSTSSRLPAGALTARLPSRHLMVVALVLAMTMVLSISFITAPAVLGIVLAGEGIAFGMFLASGHTFVAEHSTESNRGTATGIYSTAGSMGVALGPFALGPVADLWGLGTVFWLTGVMVFLGVVVILYMGHRQRR